MSYRSHIVLLFKLTAACVIYPSSSQQSGSSERALASAHILSATAVSELVVEVC